MNKTKFFSSLLVAVLFATTSVFVSCKDYDDDIKNLQSQIDKAALKADLDALSTKLANAETAANAAKTTAESALAKANVNATDIAKVKETADKAAADATKALAEVANAKSAAEVADAAAKKAQEAAQKAQETADAAKATADAAATKDYADAIKETADAAKATADAAATKAYADAIKETADAAKALADAAATKAELGEAKSSLTTELKAYADAVKEEAIAAANLAAAAAAKNAQDIQETKNQIKEELKNYATQEVVEIISGENGLQAQVNGLVKTLEAITGEENMKELVEIVGSFDTIVDALFSAVTSVELYASYSDWGNWNDGRNSVTGQLQFYNYGNNNYGGQINPLWIGLTHGTIAETSVFGDKENTIDESDPLLYYTKGDDIKDPSYLVVRVNPVNADITAAAAAGKILLINSKGESLEDIVKVTKAERYNQLITRGQTINTGLWKLSFKVADGIEQEAFYEATTSLENGWIGNILYAVAINNTNNEGAAGRYVASTFDIQLRYNNYVPATRFTFSVNNGITNTSVEEIHNRWTGALIQGEETATLDTNPELEWLPNGVIPTAVPVGLNDPANPTNVKINDNTWDYLNNNYQTVQLKDDRYLGLNYVSVAVGKPFTINAVQAFAGEIGYPYRVSIDSIYVVLDKVNAIESAPSEINAWNSYSYTGLQKTVDATKPLEITINSETANGDIIGFRVFAVNRDGSLVDPDGRSFYVYVGEGDSNMQIVSGNVVAVKPEVKSENLKTIAVKFDANVTYGAWEIVNEVEEFPLSTQPTINNVNYVDKDGNVVKTTAWGDDQQFTEAEAKKIVGVNFEFANIAQVFDNQTVIFRTKAIKYQQTTAGNAEFPAGSIIANVTKVLPTDAKQLQFRPKQEGDWKDGKWTSNDGTGKFMAYMLPNVNPWQEPWATQYPSMTGTNAAQDLANAYKVTDPVKDNGFKDLNNVFYNLNEEQDMEFVFANSYNRTVNTATVLSDLGIYDAENKFVQGITNQWPGNIDVPYMLDVHADFIDGKTEHAVTTYTDYGPVSTYMGRDNRLHFAEDWKVKSTQSLTAIYACWHHAMHNVEFFKSNKVYKPELKWKAEGNTVTENFTNIRTQNSYNNEYFGLTIGKLVDNQWLEFIPNSAELNTKADGTGQKNPYFEVTINNGVITFNQKTVQIDANPTADHVEYLLMKFKDAFGHEVLVSSQVDVKKSASAAPRF